MRNRAPRGRRRAVLTAAGLLAAGALTGCQTGPPYAYTGVARGDVGACPVSPAFARVAAGQKLPADVKYIPGAPIVVIPSGPVTPAPDAHSITTATGTPLISAPMPSGQPLVGSGGVVYPAGGAPQLQAVPPMSGQAVVPLALYTPSSVGQQTILLVNGPNGPQYVIAEVMGSAPAPVPTGMPVMPASTAMPAPAVAPTIAVVPDQAPAPTLNPPPPAAIPLPPMPAPAVVPVAMGVKAPEPAAGVKAPTGPILPASGVSGPNLDSPPAPFRAAKSPPAPGIEDEPIPPAPAFVPPKK
jgi:hypothetical protein